MPGTIYLDITTGGRRSHCELLLSRDDIQRLYEQEFRDVCLICNGALGNSTGYICCGCFPGESREHADCCLVEEET